MTLVTRAAIHLGLCPEATLPKLVNLLREYGLPTETDYPAADLLAKMLSDKKRAGDTISLVVPTGWGKSQLYPVPVSQLPSGWIGGWENDSYDLSRRSSDGDAGCHSLQIRGAPPDDLCGAGRRPTIITCPRRSQDIDATLRCLTGLGASFPAQGKGYLVTPAGPEIRADHCLLDCGESGSTLRFLLPVAGALAPTPRSSWRAVWPSGPWPPCSNSWRPTAVKLT